MTDLDFVVIGAQKCGTTSLFQYLRKHPTIALPTSKEAPYFSDDRLGRMAWEDFISEYYHGNLDDCKVGSVTPQYMIDPDVPEKLYDAFPDARLIAVLRDPVERAISHARMERRRGTVEGELSHVLSTALDRASESNLTGLEQRIEEPTAFFERGLYGRILDRYLRYWDQEDIHVLFTEDLRDDAETVIEDIEDFIGVERWIPDDAGAVYFKGGDSYRFDWLESLLDSQLATVVGTLLPDATKVHLRLALERWNIDETTDDAADVSEQLTRRAYAFYADDAPRIEQVTGRAVAWRDRMDS